MEIAQATVFAERIRAAAEAIQLVYAGNVISSSVSIGITQRKGKAPIEQLIKQADIALYDAKRAGKNCVCLYASDSFSTQASPTLSNNFH